MSLPPHRVFLPITTVDLGGGKRKEREIADQR